LEKCLISLSNQSYEDFEIIVVDSKSDDRTVEIAEDYADKILIEEKRKVGAARNIGARHAKGDILAFIDADTVASPFWLESIAQTFENDGGIVGVTGPTLPFNGDKIDYCVYKVSTEYLQRALLTVNLPYVPGFNCAYDKNDFFAVGGFDEEKRLSEDIMLSFKIKRRGRIIFNKDAVAYTSLRRVKRYGYPYMITFYTLNGILTVVAKRSFNHYPPVR